MEAFVFWVLLSVGTVGGIAVIGEVMRARREREIYRNTQRTAARNPRL
jgi:hypothetical protein